MLCSPVDLTGDDVIDIDGTGQIHVRAVIVAPGAGTVAVLGTHLTGSAAGTPADLTLPRSHVYAVADRDVCALPSCGRPHRGAILIDLGHDVTIGWCGPYCCRADEDRSRLLSACVAGAPR